MPSVEETGGAPHDQMAEPTQHISFHDFLKTCSRGALRNAEMILRKHPHYINVFDCVLTHPLHVAAANGHIGLCGFLLAKGADPLARDIDGNTALHFAARNGRCETIEQLVQLKTIEVDITNNFDETPLFVALDRHQPETAVTLLDLGAEILCADQHGEIIYDLLCSKDEEDIDFLCRLLHCALERKSVPAITALLGVMVDDKGRLDLSNLQLQVLPDEAGTILDELDVVELDLSHNALNTIPSTLQVSDVRLEGNPLDAIPETFRKSWPKIQDYLRSVHTRSTQWTECKLLFVGQEGVGKTTLLSVFKSKSGKVNCKTNLSTNGIAISPGVNLLPDEKKEKRKNFLNSPGKKRLDSVTFNCWDLGGQEVFYPTHQFFLTPNSVYILAFDARHPEHARMEYWMRQIRTLANNSARAPVFLVGTHIDHPECTEDYLERLKALIVRSFSRSRYRGKQGVFMVSCRTGVGIQELKSAIYSVVTAKNFQPQVAQSWVVLHDRIQVLKETQDVIEWTEYERLAGQADIAPEDLPLATEFLSGVGSLIHFNDRNADLHKLVILNPQWLADVMSALISFEHNWIKDGMLPLTAIPLVFKRYPSGLHPTLIALLERFSIVHVLKPRQCKFIQEEKVIVTSMLPEEEPATLCQVWPMSLPDSLLQQGKIYKFPFLPLGFFGRLMIRMLHIEGLETSLVWRNGLVASYASQHVLLTFEPAENTLQLLVRTPHHLLRNRYRRDVSVEQGESNTREVLVIRLIAAATDTLIESYRMGTIQRFIPCSHCYSREASSNPFLFTYMECVEAITQGVSTLYCRHLQRKNMAVSIEHLAPDVAFADIPLINSADLHMGRELGRGAFGIVYHGQWLGSEVAVKQLASSYTNDETFAEFQQEVFVMSQLDSPYLVALRGVTLIPKLMMVLEYLPCSDLYQLLHPHAHEENLGVSQSKIGRDQFPWSLRLLLALDIARGIQYLQSQTPPIAHRDLRTPNIFLATLDPNAPVRAKVADFGLARAIAPAVFGVLNTWQWVAPEAIFDGVFDLRSDIYSLGICFWEIASRNYPFDEYIYHPSYSVEGIHGDRVIDQVKIKKAVVHDHLRPSLPEASEDCPAAFAELITRCWAGSPEARPDIHTVVRDVEAIIGAYQVAPEPAEASSAAEDESDKPIAVIPSSAVPLRLDLEKLRTSLPRDTPVPRGGWLTNRDVQAKLQESGIRTARRRKNLGVEPVLRVSRSNSKTPKKNAQRKKHSATMPPRSPHQDKSTSPLPSPGSADQASSGPTFPSESPTGEESDKEDWGLMWSAAKESKSPHNLTAMTMSLELKRLWAGTDKGTILVYDTQSMSLVRDWQAHHMPIFSLLCVQPRILRNHTLWTGDSTGLLRIWDDSDCAMKQEWKPFPRPCRITALALFQGKRSKVWMASNTESDIFIMDTDSAQILHIVSMEDRDKPSCLMQVEDTMWVGLKSGAISIYSPSTMQLSSWRAHNSTVQSICPDSAQCPQSIWSCSSTNISMWTFKDREVSCLRTIEMTHSVLQMALVPGRGTVWCLSPNGTATMWDVETSSPMQEVTITEQEDMPLLMVPHQNFMVTMHSRNHLIKWTAQERSS